MWVSRPYIDGLVALWLGYSLGSRDGNFDRFCLWLQCDRFPSEGGHRNPLGVHALIRSAITGDPSGKLANDDDDRAVALLGELAQDFAAIG